EWAAGDADHYKKIYKSASKGKFDIYVIFIERCLQLLSTVGLLRFILPHKFFQVDFAGPSREIISEGTHIRYIVHFGSNQVFSNATTYTCLLFLSKNAEDHFEFTQVKNLDRDSALGNELLNGPLSSNLTQAELSAPDVSSGEWYFSASESAR